jgi:hypothetical protein
VTDEQEPVGSVSEEAVKLLAALQDWATEKGNEPAGAAAGAASAFSTINEHIATGGAECRYCPVCQLISAAREVSPEVKHHLSTATSSLLQAVASAIATQAPPQKPRRSDGPIEKIDLSDDAWDVD